MLVMKPFDFGGTDLVLCLRPRSENAATILLNTRIGAGTLMEVFVKISGDRYYLWRAVDQEGEVFDAICY